MKLQVISLTISTLFLIIVLLVVNKKKHTQLVKLCSSAIGLMIFWCVCLILQIIFSKLLKIPEVYFDYLVYISACFLPFIIFSIGRTYSDISYKINRKLYLIPIINLAVIWTNDFHHLFYKNYSINMEDTVVGPYMYIHGFVEYTFMFLGIYFLLKTLIKNSGFFSKQAIFVLGGISVPTVINILGTLKIIPMTIYITPICFSLAIILITISILKFNFLEATPIALQKIVDSISDSYLVLNEYNQIIDFNKTFLETFRIENIKRGDRLYDLLKKTDNIQKIDIIKNEIENVKESHIIKTITEVFENIDKIFSIDISSIISQDESIGIILLFKDITEHTKDMKKLEENQYIMQRQAQFSILGEFAGGLAHDLNSPLSAVQLDISTLQKYIKSDKITADLEIKNVINEMLENIDSSLKKMTMIIAGVRNQIRATGNTEKEVFNLRDVVSGIEILFGSILRKNNCSIENLVDENITIYGEKNKLDRVIGNVIKNSIDAYVAIKKRGKVVVFSKVIDNNCVIGIQDEAGGIVEEIAKTMFKEMKTTKAETGTGFGLYYSNTIIESSFGGKMRFETEVGKGTIFYIDIPMIKGEI